ncbi:MAG: dTDP-4-dehydrorhamnose 3,5-epimerase family protein, partial [Proteobacteria bacterium]|nr:dTDP-4-dehydrorhamnose 3,5-epimerase family protein [Pseudomonadota bacterium]
MKFTDTEIPGVVVVEIERLEDERGFFARSFCAEEFAAQGLVGDFVQAN